MHTPSFAIRALVAVAFAAIGVIGDVAGCIALLGLGVCSLVILHRADATGATGSQAPQIRQFLAWAVCIALFAGFVLLLSPLASLPAVVIALLVLSPLFGTLIFLVSSAVDRRTRRCS